MKWNVSYGQVVDNVVFNLIKGETEVTAKVTDACGNTSYESFTITVLDQAPPVAIALQNIVISLTADEGDGSAKLFAESVDNGSHDGCTGVKLEVRRETDVCNIPGNLTYNADGHPQDGSPNPNSPNYDSDGGAFVKFCCEDITNATVDIDGDGELDPGYVQVWLRVWDDGDMDGVYGTDGDNYNETWSFVKVEDKLAPSVTCPPDITITCADDYEDLSIVGAGQAFASCGEIDAQYNDIIVNLSACNEGFIRRRWSVVGRSDIFCDQTITLEPIPSIEVTVSFAQVQDFTAAGCPDDIAVGEPTWIAGACDVLGYTVDTDTFYFEDGACYKLVNHWTVINWCEYEPNNPSWNGEGIWEHTQIIKVTDETTPEILDCAPQMYAVNDHTDEDEDGIICEGKIILTNSAFDEGSDNCPTSWLKWTVLVDLWGDGTTDLEYSSFLPPFDSQYNDTNGNGIPDKYVAPTANGEEVQIALPDIEGSMSNHKVIWKVTDGCLNNTTCESSFMVVDKKAPTPYCIDISSAVMEGSGFVELWAIDFNLGSYDNCTSDENLRYTFTDVAPENDPLYDPTQRSSSKEFTCDDVENSPVEVMMYVWDEKGNADFCLVNLTLVDNNGACGDMRSISGEINTEYGDGVADVEVGLHSNLPEYPRVNPSNDEGAYVFVSTPANVEYMIDGTKDIDYTNGVSTLDLVKIQRHILELESLDSPYKVIAADINGDEQVKASDLLELRKLILGIISDLPNNESWRFVNAEQEFVDIFNPWPIDEEIETGLLTDTLRDQNFIAVKIGDVSGNAIPNFTTVSSEVRSDKTIGFIYTNRDVITDEDIQVEVRAEDVSDIFGYQFTMELNDLTFIDVIPGKLNVTAQNIGVLSDNVVTYSYNTPQPVSVNKDDVLFTLHFKAQRAGLLSKFIKLSDKVVTNEIYLGDELEIRRVNLKSDDDHIEYENYLYQNEPNPFKEETVIGFELAKAGNVTLNITDTNGKLVKSYETYGTRGYNEILVSGKDLGTSGVLYYRIESEDFIESRKMILIK